MSKESFSDKIKKKMGGNAPKELRGGCWKSKGEEKTHCHIYKDINDNFIDRKKIIASCVKGDFSGARKNIKYHRGASHMNSSQVMCINFFNKIFEKEEWEEYLLYSLSKIDVPIGRRRIAKAAFEFEPCHTEGTNFDFYMEMDDGSKVTIEVKFTEAEFGGITIDKKDPNKYDRKWENTYKQMVNQCPYLSDISKDDFYDNYQINRNIAYAGKNDIVLFLTPSQNDAKKLCKGRKYIDELDNKNIRNIYWTELTNIMLELVKDEPELLEYYRKFKEKYISILE